MGWLVLARAVWSAGCCDPAGKRRALALSVVMVALCGPSLVSVAAQMASAGDGAAAVRGVVEDAAGKPVAGAAVRLVRAGEADGNEKTSAADGTFSFALPGAAHFVLSARKDAMQSGTVEVAVGPSGDVRPRDVVLKLEVEGPASPLGSQAMEFSDSPSFTIAAVTDWTAAGGHGSDAILRTSESLTREAVQLKGADGVKSTDPAIKPVMALESSGEYGQARRIIGDLLAQSRTADRLRLAGELDEKLGDPVAAVNELEQAVHEESSEENYFAWGSELLLHRAIWQAKDVFTAGAQQYPKSARMITALGAALFACSLYDEAAQRLCEAADLSPESDEAYLFLGKVEVASPNPLRCSEKKLADFVKRRPENALASYYDAMAIWKANGRSTDSQVLSKVEALLNRAVAVDARCSDAYLQLGNLNASRRDNPAAIANYKKAIDANPQLAEAHYRLGLAYDRAGEQESAKAEFALHEKLNREQAAEVERQRRAVKQFLVKGSGPQSSNP